MRVKDGPVIRTVGELKKALAKIPDNTPLAFDDISAGYGMAMPYVATHSWDGGDHNGYYRKGEKKNAGGYHLLEKPVCVIEPAV